MIKKTILIISIVLLLITNTASADYMRVNITTDVYIRSSAPDTNTGTTTPLYICTTAICGDNSPALLYASIPLSAAATISNATLFYTTAFSLAGTAQIVPNTQTWNETTVTYNTRPAVNMAYIQNYPIPGISSNTLSSADITNLTKAWVNGNIINYGLNISGQNGLYLVIPSRESATGPYIDINYTLLTIYTSPANGSTGISKITPLNWAGDTSTHTWQISTDDQYINSIASGTTSSPIGTLSTGNLNLQASTKYYWHVHNSTESYHVTQNFTTAADTVTPGGLNITAKDEQTGATIPIFNVTIYNAITAKSKVAAGGWANYSGAEVVSGEFLIRATATGYTYRSVIGTSPGDITIYLPSTSAPNTIDAIAFYILDYTQLYPWTTSKITLSKNNTVMHSAYFDADAKAAINLIRGDSYSVTISNGANMQNWGNYVSAGSGNVEIVIMNLGVNTSLRNPFVYNVTWDTSKIRLEWVDSYGVMSSINYTILKGSSKTTVHQLITSVSHGASEYLLTNTSDIYYVSVSALTTNGYRNQTYIVDYRSGQTNTATESPDLYTWSYGSVLIPSWVKNAFAVIALAILAGTFGALHRGEGAIVTAIMSLVFWKWTWISAPVAGAGFLGAMLVFAILYHMDTKRKGGGYL